MYKHQLILKNCTSYCGAHKAKKESQLDLSVEGNGSAKLIFSLVIRREDSSIPRSD